MKKRSLSKPNPNQRRVRPRVEALESRELLSVSVIENFESTSLSAYTTVLRYQDESLTLPIAGHDGPPGGGRGLVKQDDYSWIVRNDAAVQNTQGQALSVWVRFAN